MRNCGSGEQEGGNSWAVNNFLKRMKYFKIRKSKRIHVKIKCQFYLLEREKLQRQLFPGQLQAGSVT